MKHQIVFDCTDPHLLVRFWADAMDLDVEVDSAFVERKVAEGQAQEADTVMIEGERHWRDAAACSDDDRSTRLLFLVVPEPKTVKNRVHLDLHVGEERRDAEVDRLLGLGATRLWEGSLGPFSWVTLSDPEGNEFCVA